MFGSVNWINWVNQYKSEPEKSNPHTVEKEHSNLAWVLQNTEVEVMRKVWVKLLENKIPFLSVHDEIIIKQRDKEQAEQIFRNVLNVEFEYYKLNSKTITEPEQAPKDQELKPLKLLQIKALNLSRCQAITNKQLYFLIELSVKLFGIRQQQNQQGKRKQKY